MAKTINRQTTIVMTALMYDHAQAIPEISRRSGVAPGYVARVLNDNLDKLIVSRSFDGKSNTFKLNPAKEITRIVSIAHEPRQTNIGKRYKFKAGSVAIRNGIEMPLDGVEKVAFKKLMGGLDDMMIKYPLK